MRKRRKESSRQTQATKGKQGLHLLAYYHRVGQQRQAIRLVFWNRKYREYLSARESTNLWIEENKDNTCLSWTRQDLEQETETRKIFF